MAESEIHRGLKPVVARYLRSLGYDADTEVRGPGGIIYDVYGVRGDEYIIIEILNTHLSNHLKGNLPVTFLRTLGKSSDREFIPSFRTQCNKIDEKEFKEDAEEYDSIRLPQVPVRSVQSQIQQLQECSHCGYVFKYKGVLMYCTCPSCGYKIKSGRGDHENLDNNTK